jgi:plastocyanin
MRSLKGLPVLAALVVAVAGTMWQPALAATTAVNVVDNAYEPAEVTVVVGDVVEWRWQGNNPHSVRSDEAGFDSHPQCQPILGTDCASNGDEPFRWTANGPGTFVYTCRVHGDAMAGTIVVEEAPPPEPTSPPQTETETEPPPSPEPSPEPTPPSPSPSPQPSPTSSPSPTRTATTPNVPPPVRFTETEAPSVPEPEVVSDEPSFEAFPEPVEPTVSESDDPADDEVTIAAGDDGGIGGVVWRVVGGLTVLGTALAFARVVLFGPPWDPTVP